MTLQTTPTDRQRPRNKQIYGSHFLVTDTKNVPCLRPCWLANFLQPTPCSHCQLSTNRSDYNISAQTPQKTPLTVVVQSFPWEHVCLRSRYSATALDFISRPVPSNGFYMLRYDTQNSSFLVPTAGLQRTPSETMKWNSYSCLR
jgi:hypothetical protein